MASTTPAGTPSRRGLPARLYLLAGCSVGGTLCASLASGANVNIVFAALSAIFGGGIVLLTAPEVVAAPAAPQTAASAAATATPALPSSITNNALYIGVAAGVLSYIMVLLQGFAFGFVLYTVELGTATENAMHVVKFPFDLLIGAAILTRARSPLVALAVMAVVFLVLLFGLSIMGVGDSFISVVWRSGGGPGPIIEYLVTYVALAVVAAAIGAFGGAFLNRLIQRRH